MANSRNQSNAVTAMVLATGSEGLDPNRLYRSFAAVRQTVARLRSSAKAAL
jgi:hypothetical protein